MSHPYLVEKLVIKLYILSLSMLKLFKAHLCVALIQYSCQLCKVKKNVRHGLIWLSNKLDLLQPQC